MVATRIGGADDDLSRAVLAQIRQYPATTDSDVRVTAEHRVVTLSGMVKTNEERAAVEKAAKEVWGVSAIASDLVVKPRRDRTDTEIATDVVRAFERNILIPAEALTIIVRDGCVVLEGDVHWEFQKMLAESVVKRLRGVTGVSNKILVRPETAEHLASARLEEPAAIPGTNGSSNAELYSEIGVAEAG
jgi:osmotically-inducible protein OsmY